MNDYYATLGVPCTATPEEIKKAYRKLALGCHPDRHPNNHPAEERFKAVSEAYETLGNPERRRRYDSFGNAPFGSRNSDVSGFDFSDFFRNRSENNERRTRTRTQEAPQEPYFYNGLLWEPRAYRNNNDKELLYFGQSLDRLRRAGFERHPRPVEAMQFLAASLEGKLNDAEKAIFNDMLTSYGEWLSAAFEVVPNISNISRSGAQYLRVYPDPSLHWTGSKYEWNGIPTTPLEFDVTGKKLEKRIALRAFDDALVQHLYDRPFAELPQEMREGYRQAHIILPPAGQMWPVGRSDFIGRFDVGFGDDRASRGVRSKASVPLGTQVDAPKISTGNEGNK